MTRIRRRRGNAAVEIALLAPFLSAFLVGLMEFGLVGLRHMALTGAVRAGVEYASQHDDLAGTRRTVEAAAGTGTGTVNVMRTTFCECAGVSVVCGAPCEGGGSPQVFVTVTAQEVYAPIFLSHDMVRSLLGTAATITATATFRTQ